MENNMIDEIIEKAKKEQKSIYVFAHKFPDGDAVTSSTAIVEYCKSQGINAQYVVTSRCPSISKFYWRNSYYR